MEGMEKGKLCICHTYWAAVLLTVRDAAPIFDLADLRGNPGVAGM